MTSLVTILELFTVVGLTQLCAGYRVWDDLRVRYSMMPVTGFHKVPRSRGSSLFTNYVGVPSEANFNLPIDFFCYPEDPRHCLLFDKKGNVAGIQVSFLKKDLANIDPNDYNLTAITDFQETNFFNMSAYSYRVYFTNPEKLTDAGRQNTTETAEGIWIYLKGKLIEVPREQPKSDSFENFYKQGCLTSMGLHYFHDINSSVSKCNEIFPILLLYQQRSLVGFGVAVAGRGSRGPDRDWYEHPPKLLLGVMIPNRPPCLDELTSKYSQTSTHVYLVKKPWAIRCPLFDQ